MDEENKENKEKGEDRGSSGAGNSLQVGEIVLFSDCLSMGELMNAFVNLISHDKVREYLAGFRQKKINSSATYVDG